MGVLALRANLVTIWAGLNGSLSEPAKDLPSLLHASSPVAIPSASDDISEAESKSPELSGATSKTDEDLGLGSIRATVLLLLACVSAPGVEGGGEEDGRE